MDTDEVWLAVDTERRRIADVLDDLSDAEWERPSLCDGWTVRDVAAHLTLQEVGLVTAVGQMVRHPGGMNRMIRDGARRRAAAPTGELVAAIRGMAGSRRHNVGVTCRETLIDALVHGQDIAVPLGRAHPIPPAAAAAAATRVWERKGWPFRARTRFDGLRIVATDTAWEVGSGREVSGSMQSILLLLTGRAAALPQLTGAGVAGLGARLGGS